MCGIIESFTENCARLWQAAERALSRPFAYDDIYSDENLLIEMAVIRLHILWLDFCQAVILPYAQAVPANGAEGIGLPHWCNHHVADYIAHLAQDGIGLPNWCNHRAADDKLRKLEVPEKTKGAITSVLFAKNSPLPEINAARNFFAHRSPKSHCNLEKIMGKKIPTDCSGANLCGGYVRGMRQIEFWVMRSQAIGTLLRKELANL